MPATTATTDIEQFRDEVKARLDKINDPRRAAAFAFRMALLALPGLDDRGSGGAGDKEFLWFWPTKDRERHLLAVCRSQQLGFYLSGKDDQIINLFGAPAANAANAANAADAADAYAAAYAAADIESLRAFIRQELDRLAAARDAAAYLADPAPLPFPEQHRQFLAHLRELPSFGYWADWFQARIDGEPWELEAMEKSVRLPEEVAAQGPRAVNRYLAEIASGQRREKIKRVRAIFIGNGDAGKTSLIAALNGQPVTEGGTDMTCGIDISEWQVPGTDLKAHFWDFGGQVIAHATHQFFLRERCVYVLLLNARSTDANPNQQAEYWLEFVRAFGNDAPVLLVSNKCDLAPVNVDVHRLRQTYPNLQGPVHGLACTQYTGAFAREFQIFRDAFVAELARAGEAAHLYFSPEEFRVIEELRGRAARAAFLETRDFDGICDEHGIGAGERRQGLLDLLDKLGEVIHFPALYQAGFRDFLLNPRWLTHGVYQLLYSDLLRNQHGRLRRSDVRELLTDKSIRDDRGHLLDYPEDKLDFLIQAMAAFDLCYPEPGQKDTWIVPDLLPSDQPEAGIDFPEAGALRFDFRFDTFLPRHVIGMLMVDHYRDIRAGQAWQHGVRLTSRSFSGAEALVLADYQSRVLKLAVAGQHGENYFYVLYDGILRILERMPRLQYTKRLHLPPEARIGEDRRGERMGEARRGDGSGRLLPNEEAVVDFEEVLAQRAKGLPEFTCKFGDYDWERLLRSIPEKVMERGERERVVLGEAEQVAEGGKAGAARWEKGMLAFGGLGGLAALIGGGEIFGWFEKLFPFPESLGIPLVVIGIAIMLGALTIAERELGKVFALVVLVVLLLAT